MEDPNKYKRVWFSCTSIDAEGNRIEGRPYMLTPNGITYVDTTEGKKHWENVIKKQMVEIEDKLKTNES